MMQQASPRQELLQSKGLQHHTGGWCPSAGDHEVQRHEALDTGQPPAITYSGRLSNRYSSESHQSAGCSMLSVACRCACRYQGCQKGNLHPDETGAYQTAHGSLPGLSCLLADRNMPAGKLAGVDAAERPNWDLLHLHAGLSDLEPWVLEWTAHTRSKPAPQRCRLLSCSAP